MFGWLKRQRQKEQIKLLYQNHNAMAYFSGYLAGTGDKEAQELLMEMQSANQQIADATSGGVELADKDKMVVLLQINKELRKWYDSVPYSKYQSFDKSFIPLGGWKRHYETVLDI
ncbi:MAG: hypothetical protein ACLFQT_06695 [Thiohalophilus sp.]